ncbi:GntR family transcriptional regulator [Aeromicrobium sp. P5_D10]
MKAVVDESSLTERVYEELRTAILSGELAPGSLHSVVEIASQLGVSRTPVREALLQFATDGVVRFERSRGVRILELSTKDIEDIYSLRLLLEVPAAYRAATHMSEADRKVMRKAFASMRKARELQDEPLFQRHDLTFHEAVLRGAGNERIVEAVAKTRSQMHARGLSTTATRTLDDIFAVHERIFDAIEAEDPHASARAVHDHLVGTLRLLVQQAAGEEIEYDPPITPWLDVSNLLG